MGLPLVGLASKSGIDKVAAIYNSAWTPGDQCLMHPNASDPLLFSHHHLLLTPHRLQQCHARCRPPHPYERTNQPITTSTTTAGDGENGRGSNEEQERPAHRGQRVRKRDTAPPGMAQASLYDAADHPNSLLQKIMVRCCGATPDESDSARVTLNPAPAPLSPRKQGKWPQLSVHQLAAAPARTTPPRLNDNSGSNEYRPGRPPTDAETTPSPSHSFYKRQVLQPTRCAVHAPPPAAHHPPPVSGNQDSRLAPRPSPPRTAAHSRTPATPTNALLCSK